MATSDLTRLPVAIAGPEAQSEVAPITIVSGLPLLNFPVTLRNSYMAGLIDRLEHGAPVIQFSYGTQAPVEAPPGCSVNRAALIWANIPPARVWIYRKN